jgi:GTPase SAR1 family protein/anti-sigma regulatory factor (Ser/Thr protein kinase)
MFLKEMADKNLIGRKNELEVLKSIIAEADSGDASSIFLSGNRGSGKTCLLQRLFHELFNNHDGPVPFFYSFRKAFTTIENFSKDYLGSFILQYLAFIRKEPSLVTSAIYSMEDLRDIAGNSESQGIIDIIDSYQKVREGNDAIKLLFYVMSAPYQLYRNSSRPVAVMVDDFHRIRQFSELHANKNSRDFWVLIESLIRSGNVPHIITGNQADLNRMFFEESAFGEHMDVIHLPGLNRDDADMFFKMLCEKYSLSIEGGLSDLNTVFNGNPLYIKNFVQAARQDGTSLNRDDAWEIYFREVTKGKLQTYWTSLLESYISEFQLRRPTLNFLWFLLTNDNDIALSNLTEDLAKKQDDLDRIIRLLNTAGVVETGFSTLEIADDRVLSDVIKGLYLQEIKREPDEKIREEIIGSTFQNVIEDRSPSFDVTIPPDPRAELVAVKSLEQVARHHNISLDIIGQLQIALVELFANVLTGEGDAAESYHLSFSVTDNTFCMEVETPQTGHDYSSPEHDNAFNMMKYYVDDIKVERVMNSTRIIMTKKIR